ncbi:hypothetical protein [Marinospirillum perlucidum]|uniref:hypothetical protein n=1 Tax=Marinospirillum perlucidum TaxID=1982602 RepID=UPI000DF257FC|nr:hypothetical protein [Marinospirillum perlucidum]
MQTNLKNLSRQYANGLLTKTDYRQARAELIDKAQDNDHTQPQVTVPQSDSDDEDSDDEEPASHPASNPGTPGPVRPAADQTTAPQKSPNKVVLLGGLLALLLVAVAGYFYWQTR